MADSWQPLKMIAFSRPFSYKPSKLVEIKDGKQCQEVFDAAGLEYDDIEGESLPDGGVSGPWARRE